tara:strand:+ start:144 stop:701 length:558 start_codon:yes stop_codon:yes gene_type:complete
MSEIQANKLSPASGTALQVGDSGDTITIPVGATITNSGTATGFGFTAKNFFSAYDPSNNVANVTDTKIIFESENFDTASAYNTTTGRFTVPSGEGGKYFLYAKIRHYNTTSMSREILFLRKNGSEIAKYEHKGNNVHNNIQITKVVELAAGDYIEVYYFQNSGSANNIAQFSSTNDQEFTGFRIA